MVNKQREGLIRSRIRASMVALGDTLTFLDSHVEVNEKWIEPLMTKIKQNPKIIVAPIIGMNCHYTQYAFFPFVPLCLFAHFFENIFPTKCTNAKKKVCKKSVSGVYILYSNILYSN